MFQLSRRLQCGLALLALSFGTCHAAVFCAGTNFEIQQAIASALNTIEADEVRIRTGTYAAFSGGRQGEFIGDLDISGGWQGTNCSSQVMDPTQTVFDGGDSVPVFRLTVQPPAQQPIQLRIRNLRVRNGLTAVNGSGGGLSVLVTNGSLRVERVVVSDNVAPLGSGGGLFLSAPDLSLLGSLLIRNTARDGGAGVLQILGGTAVINGNTITDNLAEGLPFMTGGLLLRSDSPSATAYLANNILWGNDTGSDRYNLDFNELAPGAVTLVRNHVQQIAGTPASGSANNTFGDPGFVDYPDILSLRENSVARNSGLEAPFGGTTTLDLFGRPRVQGGRIDRGAYEFEELFRSGFE